MNAAIEKNPRRYKQRRRAFEHPQSCPANRIVAASVGGLFHFERGIKSKSDSESWAGLFLKTRVLAAFHPGRSLLK